MTQQIGHKNEARSTNYYLTIGHDRELMFSAQNANIADISIGTTPFYSGKKELKVPSNTMNHSPLVTDILISEDFSEWITIYRWMLDCKNVVGSHLESVRTVTLATMTAQGRPATRFVYGDAFPVEMSGIQYAVNDDNSNVLTMTVTFEYNQFKVITPTGETIDEHYYTK